ncbi:hypothetical protein Pfo_011643 [Paulownia fortunei]|nr:hypothetical protein Pfo_011643 [Paulownia fortunei]
MEVLSKEKIKPSSSTPQHLQKFSLSLLDQIAPPTYVHLVLFYESPKLISNFDPSQISQNLKRSLSDVLTNFHPLAGRIIQENSSIDCNDDGVEYVETRVHACMSDVTENPDPKELQKYVPIEPCGFGSDTSPGQIPLSIQVNFFDCGGIAVGVCIAHKIADTESLVIFMDAWAATCRQEVQTVQPSFHLSRRFPPMDPSKFCSKPSPPDSEMAKNIITKRFVFDKDMLLALKKVGASSQVTNPSKIEAVTAFLWRNFMIASKEDNVERSKTNFAAFHAVNVRSRVSPPLPAHSFGNGCMQAIAWSKSENEEEQGYPVLITKLRNAIRKIDCDYVRKIINGDEYFDLSLKEGAGLLEVCIFSSWCRFPVYEVDYGWGKPHWVSTIGVPFKNLTVFMDTKTGDGIEAWVTMVEADMALIETNYKHLLSHVALDIII